MQHRFKLLASTGSLFFDVQQLVQVGLDLAFMPGQHDGVDIRKVLVKGGPANPGTLGNRRHRHKPHAMKIMPLTVRKATLTVHIISSVGWLGAIAAFLVLAIAGLTSLDGQLARAAYVGMNLVGWTVIFPLSLASLLSGITQGLGTVWGLFRHYWVRIKLIITALATVLLLVHLQR